MTVKIFDGFNAVVDDDGTIIGFYTDPGVLIDLCLDEANNIIGFVKAKEEEK